MRLAVFPEPLSVGQTPVEEGTEDDPVKTVAINKNGPHFRVFSVRIKGKQKNAFAIKLINIILTNCS
jgi:hypothetical protein